MLESVIIAFAMYSKIPMPRVEWNEKNMKFSMCFFPLIGAVIGLCSVGAFELLQQVSFGKIAIACFLTLLPILITGGIHMDGFMDTVDAKSSYKPKEEKLKILKDPNTGAFAVIYAIVHIVATFALFTESNAIVISHMAIGYAYSRMLSGLSVVTFPKARKDGMASTFANMAEKKVKFILLIELIALAIVWTWINPIYSVICLVTGGLIFLYYYRMSKKIFGGITGDLAGYFLQICELSILLVLVLAEKGGIA